VRPSIGLLILGLTLTCNRLLPVLAQDGDAALPTVDLSAVVPSVGNGNTEQADRKAMVDLQKQLADVEKTEPQQAVTRYQQFLTDHPALTPSVAVSITAAIGQVYANGLKNTSKALETYETGFEKYKRYASSVRLLGEAVKLLLTNKRGPEAASLIANDWSLITQANPIYSNPLMRAHADILKAEGKHDEIIAEITKQLIEAPAFLNDGPPEWHWRFNLLIDEILRKKRAGDALAWSKVRFMCCEYSVDAITYNTRHLVEVWTVRDPSAKEPHDFAAAQQDTSKENPLAKVPLPTVDAAAIEQALAHLPQGKAGAHDRISLLLLTGQFKPAMHEAQQLLNDTASLHDGAAEACRVFKAADLNLKRANALLVFLKSGQGVNPVEEFLKAP